MSMDFVRELWSEYDVIYIIQLIPLEMLVLCNDKTIVDPILLFADKHNDFSPWWALSQNRKISTKFYLKYENKQWDYQMLMANSAISIEFIFKYFQANLSAYYFYFSKNPNLTIEHISTICGLWTKLTRKRDYKNYNRGIGYNLDWYYICSNSKLITMDVVRDNPDWFWDYNGLSLNTNLTIEFVCKYKCERWNWTAISSNKAITMNDIRNYPNLPWVYASLSRNKNLTIEFILEHKNNDWNWCGISANDAITMDDVRQNRNLPWEYVSLSRNPNLTISFILKNFSTPDYFPITSFSQYVRTFYESSDQLPTCDWYAISQNKGITMDDIQLNPTFPNGLKIPWIYDSISDSPNITLDFILKHLDEKWDWYAISKQLLKDSLDNFYQYFKCKNESDADFLCQQNVVSCKQKIQHEPSIPWNYVAITSLQSITAEFILSIFDNCDTETLPMNRLDWWKVYINPSIFVY